MKEEQSAIQRARGRVRWPEQLVQRSRGRMWWAGECLASRLPVDSLSNLTLLPLRENGPWALSSVLAGGACSPQPPAESPSRGSEKGPVASSTPHATLLSPPPLPPAPFWDQGLGGLSHSCPHLLRSVRKQMPNICCGLRGREGTRAPNGLLDAAPGSHPEALPAGVISDRTGAWEG